MFDLKKFREENLKMTQKEFADMIGVRQDYISRTEQAVGNISLELLIKIANAAGTTIDELIDYERPQAKPIEFNNEWNDVSLTRNNLLHYLNKNSENSGFAPYSKDVIDIKKEVSSVFSKPRVAIVGHSDVGKSRLINTLLNAEKMPTSWTPMTSIIIYIKHIDERPTYMDEETWVFRNSNNGEGWDEKQIENEEYCRSLKLASGNAEILKTYGTRQGELPCKNEAGAAVLFLDSDILKNCMLLDIPGFGTGDRIEDDAMSFRAKENADILIYMSVANAFMRATDIQYLKDSISQLSPIENKEKNKLTPLSNLFVLASQAHTVEKGNLKALEEILDRGCDSLTKTMPDAFWAAREAISGYSYQSDDLRKRFFAYATDNEKLREPFEEEFKKIIEALPRLIEKNAKEFLHELVLEKITKLDLEVQEYQNIIEVRENYSYLLSEIRKDEPERVSKHHGRKLMLLKEIKKLSTTTLTEFFREYNNIMDEEKIVKLIQDKKFKKKKEDIESLNSYLISELEQQKDKIVTTKIGQLTEMINQYLKNFDADANINFKSMSMKTITPSFNIKAAFAGGLVGVGVLGGLAGWAATFGNLGAYIIIAKGVSVLSAIGIGVGGVGAAAAGVAAIGGPVGIGVALAALIAIGIFTVFSGDWKKSLAKKIIKEYEKQNYLSEQNKLIGQYWQDTELAFIAGADTLEVEWIRYIKDLTELVESNDRSELEGKIAEAKSFRGFLQNISF